MANWYPDENIQTLLYDYNLMSDPNNYYDYWYFEDGSKTYRLANAVTSMNVLVQFDDSE